MEPAAPPRIMKDKHLVLRLRQRDSHRRAIFFDGAIEQLPAAPWDIAFRIRADNYEGETLVELQIHALRQSAPIN